MGSEMCIRDRLDVVSRNWKIDVRDRFGLLLVACRDAIGNVSVMEDRV